MKILHVASEAAPYSQTGGLGQVAGTLPRALAELGDHQVSVLSPMYTSTADKLQAAGAAPIDVGLELAPVLNGIRFEVRLLAQRDGELERLFVDCPALYDRPGLYGYGDDALRFGVLCLAARDLALARELDVVHCHDWQTGPTCAYLRQRPQRPHLVFTIHNLAFQGVFSKDMVNTLGLEWDQFSRDGFEFWDQLSFLKAGAAFADDITTVSPTYAAEIQTPQFGHQLDGFFRANAGRLTGVLNGIDTAKWDPASDPRIAASYSAGNLAGKAECRSALIEEFGLELEDGELLLGTVSRLAEQKGLDLLADVAPAFRDLGIKLVVLGSGDDWLEHRYEDLVQWMPEHVRAYLGFDENLAHRIFAGVDGFVMPSRFEPCGLGQMIAMRYGTLPIVSAVGGLIDTVDDPGDVALMEGTGNGIRYFGGTASELYGALLRALNLWAAPKAWAAIQRNGMKTDWSWARAARAYIELYG